MTLIPNPQQVGGGHYKATYQHWDYCKDAGTDYLVGHCTKYLVRWRKKGGIQDLEKSLSFLEKIMVGNEDTHCDRDVEQYNELLELMLADNNVPAMERLMIWEIVNWQNYEDLCRVRGQLINFITDEKALAKSHEATPSYVNQG